MSKPPSIDRKTIKGPDEFQRKGFVVIDFIAAQRARFLAVLVALGVGLVGVLGWESYSGHRLDKGWVAYSEAVKAPEAERWEKLKTVQKDFGGARPGYFAAIALADHYFDEGRKEVMKDASKPSTSAPLAVEWFNKALEFGGALPSEKQLVTVNRGNAYELLGKLDEALADYKSASEMNADEKGYAMLNLARAYELKKDNAKAEETYTKISADFLNTEYAKSAKNQLRRMKSPLLGKS